MERRVFLKQAAITAAAVASTSPISASPKTPTSPIARAHWARPASSYPSSASAGLW
jgi:hypothetical protein